MQTDSAAAQEEPVAAETTGKEAAALAPVQAAPEDQPVVPSGSGKGPELDNGNTGAAGVPAKADAALEKLQDAAEVPANDHTAKLTEDVLASSEALAASSEAEQTADPAATVKSTARLHSAGTSLDAKKLPQSQEPAASAPETIAPQAASAESPAEAPAAVEAGSAKAAPVPNSTKQEAAAKLELAKPAQTASTAADPALKMAKAATEDKTSVKSRKDADISSGKPAPEASEKPKEASAGTSNSTKAAAGKPSTKPAAAASGILIYFPPFQLSSERLN